MLFSLLLIVSTTHAFLVYDCSTPEPQGIYQLINSEGCHHKYPPTSLETKVSGSLVQVPRSIRLPAKSTRVDIEQESTYCTYFLLRTKLVITSNYKSPTRSNIPVSTVLDWFKTGVVKLGRHHLPLRVGEELIVIDSDLIDDSGFCTVRSQTIHYTVYRVLIQSTYITELVDKRGITTSRTAYGELLSPSGLRGSGTLSDGTILTWDPDHRAECVWEHIYSGPYVMASGSGKARIALFSTLSAGLVLDSLTHVCGSEVYSTSDPQLYLSVGHTIKAPPLDISSPASWSSLIRTSIQYLGTTGVVQMNNITQTIEVNQCLLEQKLQRDIIYSAATSPELVGFRLTGGLGTAVVVSGAAIQLLKCLPRDAQLDPQQNCYDMIPVWLSKTNTSAYIDPVTFVIRNSASQISCTDPQVPYFEVRGGWYRLIPHKTLVTPPAILPSDLDLLWNTSLATYKGLYPDEVLGHEETKWLFRDQREATLNGLLNWGNKLIGDSAQNALLDQNSPSQNIVGSVPYSHWISVSSLSGLLLFWVIGLTVWISCLHKNSQFPGQGLTSVTSVSVPLVPQPAPRALFAPKSRTRAEILEDMESWA